MDLAKIMDYASLCATPYRTHLFALKAINAGTREFMPENEKMLHLIGIDVNNTNLGTIGIIIPHKKICLSTFSLGPIKHE